MQLQTLSGFEVAVAVAVAATVNVFRAFCEAHELHDHG